VLVHSTSSVVFDIIIMMFTIVLIMYAANVVAHPRRALRGGISKVNFEQSLSTFCNKCPQNGSKNGSTAPTTGLGCPHIGPFVALTVDRAREGAR